jgi:hypothetical protein
LILLLIDCDVLPTKLAPWSKSRVVNMTILLVQTTGLIYYLPHWNGDLLGAERKMDVCVRLTGSLSSRLVVAGTYGTEMGASPCRSPGHTIHTNLSASVTKIVWHGEKQSIFTTQQRMVLNLYTSGKNVETERAIMSLISAPSTTFLHFCFPFITLPSSLLFFFILQIAQFWWYSYNLSENYYAIRTTLCTHIINKHVVIKSLLLCKFVYSFCKVSTHKHYEMMLYGTVKAKINVF